MSVECINCAACLKCIKCGWCRCPREATLKGEGTSVAGPGVVAKTSSIYIIGSMRNPRVPVIAKALRDLGYDVFDDWYSVGPEADDKWQEYEKARGRTFTQALAGHHAGHVFALDKKHLDRCTAAVLVAPAGKSAHLELGYMIGSGKQGYILLDGEPERFDIMYQFATGIASTLDELLTALPMVLP